MLSLRKLLPTRASQSPIALHFSGIAGYRAVAAQIRSTAAKGEEREWVSQLKLPSVGRNEKMRRDKLKGQTGFCKSLLFLRFSAKICGFLRKAAPPKCCIFQAKHTSAKIGENLQIWLRLSLLVCPFYFLLTLEGIVLQGGHRGIAIAVEWATRRVHPATHCDLLNFTFFQEKS